MLTVATATAAADTCKVPIASSLARASFFLYLSVSLFCFFKVEHYVAKYSTILLSSYIYVCLTAWNLFMTSFLLLAHN